MGVFSTLTNIYFSRDGEWSTFAKVSVAIMVAWLVASGLLAVWCEILIMELRAGKLPADLKPPENGILSNYRLKRDQAVSTSSVKR